MAYTPTDHVLNFLGRYLGPQHIAQIKALINQLDDPQRHYEALRERYELNASHPIKDPLKREFNEDKDIHFIGILKFLLEHNLLNLENYKLITNEERTYSDGAELA